MKKNFDTEKANESVKNLIMEMAEAPKTTKTKKEPTKDETKTETPIQKNKGGRPKKQIKKTDLYKRTTLYIDKDVKAYFDELYSNDISGDNFTALVNRLLEKEKNRLEKKSEKDKK